MDLYKYFKQAVGEVDIHDLFKEFYNFFYNNGYDYDINGFSLIYFVPPSVASVGDKIEGYPTLALEFIPSDIEVEKSSIGIIGNEIYNYATNVIPSAEVSVSYIDSTTLNLYQVHSEWVKYIHRAVLGLEGGSDNKTLNYLGTIYSLKFGSDMKTPLMLAKATGVFPNFVPYKEYLGPRSQNLITICNCSYTTYYFQEEYIG